MTLMHRDDDRRKNLRRRYPVVVRLRCGRCGRIVGECYGRVATVLSACWSESGGDAEQLWTGRLMGLRLVRCRCRCGADHPISGQKLVGAFKLKAAEPTKRDRVITLPVDLST